MPASAVQQRPQKECFIMNENETHGAARTTAEGAAEKAQSQEAETKSPGQRLDELIDNVSSYVKTNPERSLLMVIPFGLGLVAGLIMRGKKSQCSCCQCGYGSST